MNELNERARRMVIDQLKLVIPQDEHFYKLLSCNPNLRYSDVLENKTAPWDWSELSHNPGITLHDIVNHPDDPWVWSSVNGYSMNFCSVSSNQGIHFKKVLQHLDKPWSWFELSANPTITIHDIRQLIDKPWNWYILSRNEGIPWSDVRRYPDLPWNFEALSRKPNNDDEPFMLANFDKWSWNFVSENVSLGIIKAHMDWPWEWESVCRNPNIPFTAFPSLTSTVYLYEWSRNPNMTIEHILPRQLRSFWIWAYLSELIDFQDILQHPNLPWNFDHMGRNKSLRLDYVLSNRDQPWNHWWLARNPFIRDYKENFEKLARRHLAAYKIQVYWRHCASNHKYNICHTLQLKRIK